MGKLLIQIKEGKLSANEELVPGDVSAVKHKVQGSTQRVWASRQCYWRSLCLGTWGHCMGLDHGPSPPGCQDAAVHLQAQIPAVSSRLSYKNSKHLTSFTDEAKNIFIPSLCLPSPSGLQATVKLKSEATDDVSHWTCSIHPTPLISFLWWKIVLTKQDETFNASQMLRGMQNKGTAKHFQPFSSSTSSLYSKN